ncbi:sialate O-acetylesterase [Paenibacillus spongiae]|uniref:Sialate O-acetylesterase n=1 Tax=Paenibacillus spongiae TaxID=2909671 RepID=A0ABY5SFY3_9BACL|nr:sialate O-acetylesterase [Paenibacillus spongiae]UVI32886.1 sialate O-acetylesterase [Paenibacillus spongiae]
MTKRLTFSSPEAHRVYQRDERNRADITFSVQLPDQVKGRVEARISAGAWRTLGLANEPVFEGVMEAVPVGEHSLYVRVLASDNKELLAEGEIGPVFVGDLWIIAGQSNAEGCGKLIDIEEPQTGVSCFYMGDRWDLAVEPLCWVFESPDPIHWMHIPEGASVSEERLKEYAAAHRRDRVQGAGFGIPFGKMLLQHTGIPVGLLMVAHGGTSMSQWSDELADEGGHSLYGAMLRVIQASGGKVKGCLWYQGESDADESVVGLYYDRMIQWVASLRRDLGDPELPFIYAQIATVMNWGSEAAWNRIQDEQLRLESKLGRAALVPTIDSVLADAIHPDASSLRDIGHRMAWAALRLVHDRPLNQTGPRLAYAAWNGERTELTLTFTGVNGRLRPVERAFAFQVTNGEHVLPLTAHLDAEGHHIVLRLEQSAPESCELRHGRGINPTVNVRDELGIPLPVFGPLPV